MADFPPRVLGDHDTIDWIVQKECSFARLGDGEYRLVMGQGCKTQAKDQNLTGRLREILQNRDPRVLVGILDLYSGKAVATPWRSRARTTARYGTRAWAASYLRPGTTYGCASVTRLCNWALGDRPAWWAKVGLIWQDRDVLLVTGSAKGVQTLPVIKPRARSVASLQLGKKVNAWSDYEQILGFCLDWSSGGWKKSLVLSSLGATATVLAYDLGLRDVQALDIGHLAQSFQGIEPKGLPEP
jgi:hypothetical protein